MLRGWVCGLIWSLVLSPVWAETEAQAADDCEKVMISTQTIVASTILRPSGFNDTTAIQMALDNLSCGEELLFSTGTYFINDTLELRQDNVTLTFLDGAKLKVIGSGTTWVFLSFADNTTFNDLNIDGNNKANIGIELYKVQNVTLNRPVIKNVYGDWGGPISTSAQAIRVRTGTNVNILDGTIENVIASSGSAVGILVLSLSVAEKSFQITIQGGRISNVKANKDSDGISFLAARIADLDVNSSIIDIEFYNTYKRAIKLQADNITISNVTIVNDFIDETVTATYLIDFQNSDDSVLDGADISFTGSNLAAIGLGGNNNIIKNVNIRLTRKSIDSSNSVWAIRNQGWSINNLLLQNINIYGDFSQAVRIATVDNFNFHNITLDNIYSRKLLLWSVRKTDNSEGSVESSVENSTFGSYYFGNVGSVDVSQSNLLTAKLEPIARYKFDEASGKILDDSGNNDSSATANLAYSQPGVFQKSIGFNGTSSYIKISNSSSLNAIGHHITISAWVYPEADGGQVLVNKKWDGDTGGFDFRMASSGRLFFRIGDGSQNVTRFSDLDVLTLNAWQHVAVVYNGVTAEFYINGQRRGSAPMEGRIGDNNVRPIFIGKHQGNTNYFDGKLDDVRIYNRSLTQYQIKEAAYMSAYYQLDGNGTDETGYNNATVSGAPATVAAKVNTGFDFQKSEQFLSAVDDNALNLGKLGENSNSNLTIAAWINPRLSGFDKTIVNKGYISSSRGYELRSYGTTLRLWINGSFVQSAGILMNDLFQHVVATYDGSNVYFYVNGELQDTKELSAGSPIANSNDLTIGIYANKNSYRFNGVIDDLKLFKFALTQEDIFELFSESWKQ